jgi:hypothetical protein
VGTESRTRRRRRGLEVERGSRGRGGREVEAAPLGVRCELTVGVEPKQTKPICYERNPNQTSLLYVLAHLPPQN